MFNYPSTPMPVCFRIRYLFQLLVGVKYSTFVPGGSKTSGHIKEFWICPFRVKFAHSTKNFIIVHMIIFFWMENRNNRFHCEAWKLGPNFFFAKRVAPRFSSSMLFLCVCVHEPDFAERWPPKKRNKTKFNLWRRCWIRSNCFDCIYVIQDTWEEWQAHQK